MVEIVIGALGGTSELRIRPLGRAHPTMTDYWDGNWLRCRIQVRISGLSADLETDLRVDEFVSFRRELHDANASCKGAARFRSLEPWLAIDLIVTTLGGVRVHGVVRAGPVFGDRLEFDLPDLDLSYVPHILGQLDDLIDEYPLRGAPTD